LHGITRLILILPIHYLFDSITAEKANASEGHKRHLSTEAAGITQANSVVRIFRTA